MTVQVLGPLPPAWETQMEFLHPAFKLAKHWLWWAFEG